MSAIDITEYIEDLLRIYSPEQVDEWLDTPHPQLDGITPLTAIRTKKGWMVKGVIKRLLTEAHL